MKILSIINDLNGGKNMPLLSKELGISKDTLRRRLNELGYKYDNSEKKYIFIGDKMDKNKIDNIIFDAKNNKKRTNKLEKNKEKNIKKEDENNLEFTQEEIKKLKEFSSSMKDNDISLFLEIAFLPSNERIKKTTIDLSQKIYDDFEVFAKKFAKRRISKKTLIELALTEFMKKYHG
ncbi:TPA: hypothetical protein ACTZ2U_005347 [Bacillus cereus]